MRVVVSLVQPALFPGSPRKDGFHVLIIGHPQGRDKEEWRDEQIHQLGNQLSYTPYYAASPKRKVTVVFEKTKRTPSLVLYRMKNGTWHKRAQ